MVRNTYLPPKGKYVKINRVWEKEQRMDKFADIIEKEKVISSYQLQKFTGFGNGTFYNIGQAVLQAYPKSYEKFKGGWKLLEEIVKAKKPLQLTTEWDSNFIPITV